MKKIPSWTWIRCQCLPPMPSDVQKDAVPNDPSSSNDLQPHALPVPTNHNQPLEQKDRLGRPEPKTPTVYLATAEDDEASAGSFGQGAYPAESTTGQAGPPSARLQSPETAPKRHTVSSQNYRVAGVGEEHVMAQARVVPGDESDDENAETFAEGAYPASSTTTTTADDDEIKTPTVWPTESLIDDDDDSSASNSPEESSFPEGAYPSASIIANDDEEQDSVPTATEETIKKDSVESVETTVDAGTDQAESESSTTESVSESALTMEEETRTETQTLADDEREEEGAGPTTSTNEPDDTVPTVYPPSPSDEESDEETSSHTEATETPPSLTADDSSETGDAPENDQPADSKPPKKEGSLASFFEKVNKKKDSSQDNLSDTFAAASQIYTAQAKREGILVDGNAKKTYRGVWGELSPNRRQPDISVLFELFQDAFVEAVTGLTKKETDALVDGMGDSLDAKTADLNVNDVLGNEPKEKPQLANEFVDGLDDIDKLFEEVDPPNELDIAALGHSMQEILVGRTSHIVRKRLMMGFQFTKKWVIRGKDAVVNRFKSENGRIRFFTREELKNFGQSSLTVARKAYTFTVDFVDSLLDAGDGDDDDSIDEDYLQEIQKRTVSN